MQLLHIATGLISHSLCKVFLNRVRWHSERLHSRLQCRNFAALDILQHLLFGLWQEKHEPKTLEKTPIKIAAATIPMRPNRLFTTALADARIAVGNISVVIVIEIPQTAFIAVPTVRRQRLFRGSLHESIQ